MNIRKSISSIAIASSLAFSLHAQAAVDLFGDYNVTVFNNFSSENSDSEGNVAAGGNVNLSNYSVASSRTGTNAKLVAGGHVNATNGGVGSGQNGTIWAASTTLNSFTARGGVETGSVLDFVSLEQQSKNTSSNWGTLTANGNVNSLYGSLNLTGTDSTLNIFDLNGSDLTSTGTINLIAPEDSTVLINVSGTGQEFKNGQVFLNGLSSTNIVYNFYESTSINLVGSKNPLGTILAPWADVVGGYGALNGQLIAQSFDGNIEFHDYNFSGQISSPVPEPSTWLLLGSGLLLISVASKRKANS
jgi:choice-of-anchor A domain-containing protein